MFSQCLFIPSHLHICREFCVHNFYFEYYWCNVTPYTENSLWNFLFPLYYLITNYFLPVATTFRHYAEYLVFDRMSLQSIHLNKHCTYFQTKKIPSIKMLIHKEYIILSLSRGNDKAIAADTAVCRLSVLDWGSSGADASG